MTAELARLANHNAAVLWTVLAQARGYGLVRRPGLLGVDGGAVSGVRLLLTSDVPDTGDLALLDQLVDRAPVGELVVEDPYGTVDLTGRGLQYRLIPVMAHLPGPLAGAAPNAALPVTRVSDVDQLAIFEQLVLHGFPLNYPERYAPGRAFPVDLLSRPEIELFLIFRDGEPAGGCAVVHDEAVSGLYWVTTAPAHRSHGVGRALMHAVLRHLDGRTVTLTASRAGRPLYESLGLQTVTQATWWG